MTERIYAPDGAVGPPPMRLGRVAPVLAGLRIGVLDNAKPNARLLMVRAAEQIARTAPAPGSRWSPTRARVSTAATPCTPEVFDQLVKEVDLVTHRVGRLRQLHVVECPRLTSNSNSGACRRWWSPRPIPRADQPGRRELRACPRPASVTVDHPLGGTDEATIHAGPTPRSTTCSPGSATPRRPGNGAEERRPRNQENIEAMSITIDHAGKVALVTGAGAGIGREIARWLARAGAAVAVNDIRAANADAVVAEIEAAGGRAAPVVADCRDDEQVDHMVTRVVDHFGGLDIAVNNIGMLPTGRNAVPFVEMDGSYWRDLLDQNLVLAALCAPRRGSCPARTGARRCDHQRVIRRDDTARTVQRELCLGQGGAQSPDRDDGRGTRPDGYPGDGDRSWHHLDRNGTGRLHRRACRADHRVDPAAAGRGPR